VVADTLLALGARRQALVDQLAGVLPASITIYAGRPTPSDPTPFVVLDLAIRPGRTALSGAWDSAELTLKAWSVHDTLEQAGALADLVRTWVLTSMTTPGKMDVDVDQEAYEDDPGGVQQVYESWTVAVTRT
jgi:hypothetical protein